MSLLTVEDLRVGYVTDAGVVTALHGLSMTVERGQSIGLVGESGSGKSTAVHAILRTLPPPGVVLGGRVDFDGVDLMSADAAALRRLRWERIALVTQSALSALNPVLRVREHVLDTSAAHTDWGTARAVDRGVELLELAGLSASHLDRYAHELSGGERQRVVLALSLLLDPELVVLDEPTTALDVVVERELLDHIDGLRARLGFATIFISHDLRLIQRYTDALLVLKDGRLVEHLPSERLDDADADYTRALAAAVPEIHTPRLASLQPDGETGGTTLVEVRDVTHRYEGHTALRGVSLHLEERQIVALVGASGSGKSTLGRAMCGMLSPSEGTVLLKGSVPVRGAWRRHVQLVFQDPYASLNPVHTVHHHLARPLLLHGHARAGTVDVEVASLLELVELDPELAARHPHELSGGQRQRVAIARALAVRPEVLVADEPTSMLDVSVRMGVLRLLARIREERGVAVLLITHDLASARHLADRIAVLHAGELVELASSDTLIAHPAHSETRRLLAAADRHAPRSPS